MEAELRKHCTITELKSKDWNVLDIVKQKNFCFAFICRLIRQTDTKFTNLLGTMIFEELAGTMLAKHSPVKLLELKS